MQFTVFSENHGIQFHATVPILNSNVYLHLERYGVVDSTKIVSFNGNVKWTMKIVSKSMKFFIILKNNAQPYLHSNDVEKKL